MDGVRLSGGGTQTRRPDDGGSRTEEGASRPRKALTIGAVCKILSQEYGDISISKIRYLEDQKLLSPRRTRGGYRLYSQADVEQLRSILRMQRDEFLPLKVIRQELAAGKIIGSRGTRDAGARRATSLEESGELITEDELVEQTGASRELLRELEDYKIIESRSDLGRRSYDENDLELVRAAVELARFGVHGRNMRIFKTAADREAALLEQILGPGLQSRSQARRQEALESLEGLASTCTQLKHLLLVRDLRRLKG